MSASPLQHPVARALAEALAPGVQAAAAPIDAQALFRHTSEAQAVEGAVEKRRLEFATGRRLAHLLLDGYGAPSQPLMPLPSRAPAWPREAVGSISHTDELCVAIVGRSTQVLACAVDVEPDEPLDSELWSTVLTDRELGELGGDGLRARAIFSAKECYWKLVAHRARRMLDFREVEVQLGRQKFSATVLVEGVVHRRDVEVEGVSLGVAGWRVSGAVA